VSPLVGVAYLVGAVLVAWVHTDRQDPDRWFAFSYTLLLAPLFVIPALLGYRSGSGEGDRWWAARR
jgi:hypothetical protein